MQQLMQRPCGKELKRPHTCGLGLKERRQATQAQQPHSKRQQQRQDEGAPAAGGGGSGSAAPAAAPASAAAARAAAPAASSSSTVWYQRQDADAPPVLPAARSTVDQFGMPYDGGGGSAVGQHLELARSSSRGSLRGSSRGSSLSDVMGPVSPPPQAAAAAAQELSQRKLLQRELNQLMREKLKADMQLQRCNACADADADADSFDTAPASASAPLEVATVADPQLHLYSVRARIQGSENEAAAESAPLAAAPVAASAAASSESDAKEQEAQQSQELAVLSDGDPFTKYERDPAQLASRRSMTLSRPPASASAAAPDSDNGRLSFPVSASDAEPSDSAEARGVKMASAAEVAARSSSPSSSSSKRRRMAACTDYSASGVVPPRQFVSRDRESVEVSSLSLALCRVRPCCLFVAEREADRP